MNNHIEIIRGLIREMKLEASGKNRPDVNRTLLDGMVQTYKSLSHVDLSDTDRDQTISILCAVSTINKFLEMGELDQVQMRLQSMFSHHGQAALPS